MERADHRRRRIVERRDTGLGRIRSLTMAVAVGAVGGVGALAGYFSHAVPGRHATGSAATTTGSITGNSGANTGSTANSGNSGSVGNGNSGSSGALSTPAAAPQRTRSAPQVVSGSS